MHLAELNIARLKYPIDDPRVAEFADNLDLVNGIAERSPGFVWRWLDETGAAGMLAFDDPFVIVNMSVWRDAESLEHFVWNTLHKRFYQKREHWFSLLSKQHFAMWWVDEGELPTVDEAKARLDHFDAYGNTDHAFGWSHLPHVKLWRQARCA